MNNGGKRYLLGIDVGTTGTKTMLLSPEGECLGHAYRSYETHTPNIGWCEQDPNDWWQAVVETVRQVCAAPEIGSAVAGISLSVQGGTTVPVDKNYTPVRPAIVWNDIRCTREQELFLNEVGDSMYARTGWNLCSSLNALQIRWMKDHEPENFQKTAMFLSVPDYIAYKMTGIPALDYSNVGINQLGNISQRCYDPDILGFSGIREEQLPAVYPSGTPIGKLSPEAAEELGLSTECVFSVGAHDQYAVALGAGAVKDGDILIGSGTCWVITCIKDNGDFDSGLSQSVAAVPGKWGSLWSLSSGGICLEWIRKNILGADGQIPDYETLNREAAQRRAAEDGLFFYPFLGICGENQRLTKGSFIGLDLSHDKFHLVRAIMEGVVFQIVWMMEAFHTELPAEGLKLAGGASKSPLWVQLLADISGVPIRIPEVPDLACIGAAILAGVGSGQFSDMESGYKTMNIQETVVYPDPDAAVRYAPLIEQYKRQAKCLGQACNP